jgi:hypothetical protein
VPEPARSDQFVDGNRVCRIVDWDMALPVAPMTAAEELRSAMA